MATVYSKQDENYGRSDRGTPERGASVSGTYSAEGRYGSTTRSAYSQTGWAALQTEIERLGAALNEVARARGEVAVDTISDGVHETRRLIRQNPWTAIGVAAAAGVLVALTVTSRADHATYDPRGRRARSRLRSDLPPFAPMTNWPDMSSYVQTARAASSDVGGSIIDGADRLAKSIADLDPKSAAGPLLDAVRKTIATIAPSSSK